jgi:osmoprotectant transport system substrate-binding protein
MARRAVLLPVLLSVCVVLAGCGSSGAGASADERPVIRLGTKNFTEQFIVGEIYAQALRAKGFRVDVKRNLGSSELVHRALSGGAIDLYPEYIGVIVQEIARQPHRPRSADETYREAKAFEAGRGFEVLDMSPGFNRLANAVTAETARRHGLRTMPDLERLGRYRYGAFPENRVRFQGALGVRKAYGLDFAFIGLPNGRHYEALDRGDVDVIDVGTTDAQLSDRSRYRVLADPKGIFGYQNIAPIVSRATIRAQGPGLARTLDAVTAALTNAALQEMNGAVDLGGRQPAAVARRFLLDHQLL